MTSNALRAIVSPWLLAAATLLSSAHAFADTHCHAVLPHEPSAAEKALMSGNGSEAENLYRDALSKTPHDATLTVGLIHSLLRQQKVSDAETTARANWPAHRIQCRC